MNVVVVLSRQTLKIHEVNSKNENFIFCLKLIVHIFVKQVFMVFFRNVKFLNNNMPFEDFLRFSVGVIWWEEFIIKKVKQEKIEHYSLLTDSLKCSCYLFKNQGNFFQSLAAL